mgnify:CR=1 FL=1
MFQVLIVNLSIDNHFFGILFFKIKLIIVKFINVFIEKLYLL